METHTCPVWIGYLMASPIRKLLQSPKAILNEYVKPTMTVLDIGSAMGFFSIPMAEMVGPNGRVICFDIQQKMLEKLKQRAEKAGVDETITTVVTDNTGLAFDKFRNEADFALFFACYHEIDNRQDVLRDTYRLLKPGAKVLLSEPKLHVSEKAFADSIEEFKAAGFIEVERPEIAKGLSVVFEKRAEN